MAVDVGLTHIALAATHLDASIAFYAKYARMQVIHERTSPSSGKRVVWLSDKTRPFALVLIESDTPDPVLKPCAHIGVGCTEKGEVDRLATLARDDGVLVMAPSDSGYPVGYWALLKDPDGHSLELSYGQEVSLATEAQTR